MNRNVITGLFLSVWTILACPTDTFAKPKNFVVTEIHYLIGDDGSIDRNTVIEKKILEYNQGKFVTGTSLINNKRTVLTSEEDKYNPVKYVVENENEKVAHHYTRNERNDLTKDSITVDAGPGKRNTAVYTYEYFYLGKFTHATNKEGVTAVSGYVDDPDTAWVLRTVRCNGKVCQHAERKYKNGKMK